MTDDPVFETGTTRREIMRRAGIGAAALAVPGTLASSAGAIVESAKIKRGGTLRVAFVGGGPTETLDPDRGSAIAEIGMTTMMFEKLFDTRGPKGTVTPILADFMEPNNKKGDMWTLRVKRGITWHNGKTFTIDDVIYTLQRILTKKNALAGSAVITFMDPKGIKKIDPYTARFHFLSPFGDPAGSLVTRFFPIVQNGATDFAHPVGTGPFKFKSFVPGKSGLFVANPNYHGGAPYLDAVSTVDIPDPTARVNALLGGQVDAIEALPGAQAAALKTNPKVHVLASPNGGHSKMCFTTTIPPFTDVRVRQALRLLCNRPLTIQNGVFGLGVIGNDLTCRFDPDYDHQIPQRTYDPAQAMSLLKAAGQSGLTLTLQSGPAAVAMLESAQILGQTASAGGVTITVNNNPGDTYYTKIWGNAPFFQDEWGAYPLHDQLALNYISGAPYNGYKYSNPTFDKLFAQAARTLDATKRRELYDAAQKELWNTGPDIVWGSPDVLDLLSVKVHGIVPSPVRPLGYFQFQKAWLA